MRTPTLTSSLLLFRLHRASAAHAIRRPSILKRILSKLK